MLAQASAAAGRAPAKSGQGRGSCGDVFLVPMQAMSSIPLSFGGAAVLSVDYHRSPEHRFPTAYDDGLAALRFLDDGRPDVHGPGAPPINAARCFLAGDSTGGNIAHHVARRYALDPSAFANLRLAGLIAIQPFFGGEEHMPTEQRFVGAPIVSVPRTDWMWRAFLPHGADHTHEASSPEGATVGIDDAATAAGFFLPATVVIGGYDPLQDWQRRYRNALCGKGKEVSWLRAGRRARRRFLRRDAMEGAGRGV